MTCQDYESDLALHAGGDLPAERATRLEQHLRTCASCRHDLRSLRETREALRRADVWDENDEAALASVRAAVGRQVAELQTPRPATAPVERPLRLRLRPIAALAASLALALGLQLRLGRDGELPEPPPITSPLEGPSQEGPIDLPAPENRAAPSALPPTDSVPPVPRPTEPEPPEPSPPPTVSVSKPSTPHDVEPVPPIRPAEDTVVTTAPALEPAWIKLVSDDLVIYWLVDSDEEPEESSHVSTTS